MNITEQTVAHYARLASLEFSPEETKDMAHDLGSILSYVEKIRELDLSGIEATTQVLGSLAQPREDSVGQSLQQAEALANAPDHERGHFLVPIVINKS